MRSFHAKRIFNQSTASPLLIILITIIVYFPAIISGYHFIDDPGIVDHFSSFPSIFNILTPGNSYYRPVLEISFLLDSYFWGMNPVAMHVENVLIHCTNSIFIYFILKFIIRKNADPKLNSLPLFAGLFFALHPANTEPVAWIAGRTDPLMSLFVLSSFYLLLWWLETGTSFCLAASVIFLIAGMLTKETAFAAAFVIFLLFLAWPESRLDRKKAVELFYAAFLLGIITLFILYLHKGIFAGTYSFTRLLSLAGTNSGQGLWEGLAALGFYFKKMVAPLPLNFAIIEISSIYGIVALLFFFILVWSFSKDRRLGLLLLSSSLTLLPAIAVAYVHIAWTPFAERYLYLPTFFFTLWLVMTVYVLFENNFRMVCTLASFLLLFFSAAVLQRTILWGDKAAFIEDAIAKSPEFGSLYNERGGVLLKQGRIEAAREAFHLAEIYNKRDSMRLLIKANQMIVMLAEGSYGDVRNSFFKLFRTKDEAPADFLELLFKADNRRLNELNGTEKLRLAKDLNETLALLYRKRPDPFWLYQRGKMAIISNENSKAHEYFKMSYSSAPADAHYREAAFIYINKLESIR